MSRLTLERSTPRGRIDGAMAGSDKNAAPVLQIRHLAKSFRGHLGIGRTVALENLDLEIRAGEVYGLLGPNGAGKTTAFKLMLGLLRPDRGEVRMFGRPASDPVVRNRIGYLPENPYFYDYLTANEFLDFYARLQGIPASQRASRTAAVLRRVGLDGHENRALRKFSKGMTQRLGLAQAIQHDPDLVILDEPMSGLDPIGRRDVRDLILSMKAHGRTVLFSSHILQDAELVCDRVAILDRGRLRSVGKLDEMVSAGVEWFEVTLHGTYRQPTGVTIISRDGEHSLVRVADLEALAELMAAVREAGSQVNSVWPKRKTLEDLFLHELHAERSAEDRS